MVYHEEANLILCLVQKLKAIEELKEQQAAGKQMQKNQVLLSIQSTLKKKIFLTYGTGIVMLFH